MRRAPDTSWTATVVAARPRDPRGAAADRAAVRILARVAALEGTSASRGGGGQAPRRRRLAAQIGLTSAAVLLLAAALPLQEGARPVAPSATLLAADVEAALGGDGAARGRVAASGAAGRGVLLGALKARLPEGDLQVLSAGLRILERMGGVLDERTADAVASLAAVPGLAAPALHLMSQGVTRAGPERLGRLLVEEAAAEPVAVAALRRVAAGGRRDLAVRLLLEGAAAGRLEAAAEALRLAGATGVDALLAAVPDDLLHAERLCVAVRSSGSTVAARLLRRAEAGDERALGLAVAARLDGIVPLLHARAVGDPARAPDAVAALERLATVEAWVALARAMDGPAGSEAASALQRLDEAAHDALRSRIREAPRDRAAALLALAASWAPGGVAAKRPGDVAAKRPPIATRTEAARAPHAPRRPAPPI